MKRKSLTVAVTGFGVRQERLYPPEVIKVSRQTNPHQPYREYDYNNSAAVRDGLPSQITRNDKPPINIIRYPHDINCIYTELLDLTPQLWNGKRSVYEPGSDSTKPLEIDLMIHIGMHPDDDVYFLETRARRGKYEHSGDDGKFLSREALKGRPEILLVGFDIEDVAARVRRSIPVRIIHLWPTV